MATANSKVQKLEGSKAPAWLAIVREGLDRQRANKDFNLTTWLVTKDIPATEREVVDTHITPMRNTSKEGNNVAVLATIRRAIILGSKGFKACIVEGTKVFDADPSTKKSKAGYSGSAKSIADRIADARCEGLDMKNAIAKAKSIKAPVGVLKVAKAEGASHIRALTALKARLELDAKGNVGYTSALNALAAYF